MSAFSKILCPVDFSEYSRLALRYAIALARENEAPLVICHAVPDLSQIIRYLQEDYVETVREALISTAREKLDELIKDLENIQTIRTIRIIEEGNPADFILQIARKASCDLIVMGTYGLSGPDKFLTGSVTNKVIQKTTIPVLTVCRPTHHFIHSDEEHPVRIKKILCGLDYDDNSRNIARMALRIGRMYGSSITFFHTVPKAHPDEWQSQQQWVKDKLRDYIDPAQEDDCEVNLLVRSGDPAEQILKLVKEDEMDLVIMGHHSQKRAEDLFLGSVAKKVITDSLCPVLLARSTQDVLWQGLTFVEKAVGA